MPCALLLCQRKQYAGFLVQWLLANEVMLFFLLARQHKALCNIWGLCCWQGFPKPQLFQCGVASRPCPATTTITGASSPLTMAASIAPSVLDARQRLAPLLPSVTCKRKLMSNLRYKIIKSTDSNAVSSWWRECSDKGIPFIVVKTYQTKADIQWDCTTLSMSCDDTIILRRVLSDLLL